MVYFDANDDGQPNPNEPPVPGARVTLTNDARTPVLTRTTTTGGDGSFRFDSVPPGTYLLRVELPPGYGDDPTQQLVVVAPGGSSTAMFGSDRIALLLPVVSR